MIPPCRYCDGAGQAKAVRGVGSVRLVTCPRCDGSQLDEAWQVAISSDRPGFARIRIAYGAHAAARPLVDTEMVAEAAELLLTVLGSGNRRGLIIRDRRP